MSDLELKSCPFCGGRAHLERNSRAFIFGLSQRVSYVYCENCNARTDKIPIAIYGGPKAREKAREAWNRRANHG